MKARMDTSKYASTADVEYLMETDLFGRMSAMRSYYSNRKVGRANVLDEMIVLWMREVVRSEKNEEGLKRN